jgi:DNA-binding winged helix-turn-helix (wHTH) protein
MSLQTKHIYEFGPFRLDAAEHLLLRDGEAVPLTPKAFDLLLALVERHGHLLEKDELLKTVWPDTFVEEANLASNISQLRKTLGDGSLTVDPARLIFPINLATLIHQKH